MATISSIDLSREHKTIKNKTNIGKDYANSKSCNSARINPVQSESVKRSIIDRTNIYKNPTKQSSSKTNIGRFAQIMLMWKVAIVRFNPFEH